MEEESFNHLLPGHLDVSWDTEGAEWEHHLRRRLIERLGNASMYNQWHGPPVKSKVYIEFSVTNPVIRSRLRLVPEESGTSVLLVTDGAGIAESERELWMDAVSIATERVGTEHPEFSWFSLIACEPLFDGEVQVLEAPATVAGLAIQPSGVTYWEAEPERAALDGWGLRWSSPVIVEGRDIGFNSHAAELKGAHRLAKLRSILSVVFDERWRIKLSPLNRKIPVPDAHPTLNTRDHAEDMEPGGNTTRVAVPDWLNDAWKRVSDNEDLSDALAMYYEALEVWDGHPSLALICLVAVIEGMGSKYQSLETCDCCERCTARIGSGKRFRAALSVVLSNDEAKPLIAAYTPRSGTVHAGRLHGTELAAGAIAFGLTQADPLSDFEMGLVGDLRRAARELLLLALKGELPDNQRW